MAIWSACDALVIAIVQCQAAIIFVTRVMRAVTARSEATKQSLTAEISSGLAPSQ
jgi:hypothetical protein